MNWLLILVITTVPGVGAPSIVETSLSFETREICTATAQAFVDLSTLEQEPEPSTTDYDFLGFRFQLMYVAPIFLFKQVSNYCKNKEIQNYPNTDFSTF